MQASKTATEGSNAIAPSEVLGVLGERLHRRLLGVDPRLQGQHVLQLRAAMLSDIPEREIAHVHAVNDKRAGDAQDVRRIIRAEFLILGRQPAFPEGDGAASIGAAAFGGSSDYPAEFTEVGFHGHYGNDGKLNAASVASPGLAAWIEKYSDGKADPALVERWVNIPFASGLMHFYPPEVAGTHGAATFMCQGNERGSVFNCEAFKQTALDLGIITSTDLVASNDQAALRATVPARIVPSGWAPVTDIDKVPLETAAGRAEYQRFLKAPLPRSFAISPTGWNWAWNGGLSDALPLSLSRCRQRSGSAGSVYAVDDDVVWNPAKQPGSAPGTQ